MSLILTIGLFAFIGVIICDVIVKICSANVKIIEFFERIIKK